MTTKIEQKIVDYDVVKQQQPEALQDVNPDDVVFEDRPEGILTAENNQLVLYTVKGKIPLYISVSYMPVRGVINGEEVVVERAVEAFFPVNQRNTGEESHWIVPVMKLLSYAFRQSGNVARVLREIRETEWTGGLVTCGKSHKSNKPLHHDSIAAAVGWGFSEMLRQRGLLDDEFNYIPAEKRIRPLKVVENNPPQSEEQATESGIDPSQVVGTCPDTTCGGDMVMKDKCPTCVSCGYSKCG